MIVYLHPQDSDDAGRTLDRHRGQDVRHVPVPDGVSVSRVVDLVVSRLAARNPASMKAAITLLVIEARCSPGRIHLSGSDVYEKNADAFASPFAAMLKPLTMGGEGVEIRGGYVASGSVDPRTLREDDPYLGIRFLYQLARAFGHRVKADARPEFGDSEGSFETGSIVAVPSEDTGWYDASGDSYDFRSAHSIGLVNDGSSFVTVPDLRDPREWPYTNTILPPNPGRFRT